MTEMILQVMFHLLVMHCSQSTELLNHGDSIPQQPQPETLMIPLLTHCDEYALLTIGPKGSAGVVATVLKCERADYQPLGICDAVIHLMHRIVRGHGDCHPTGPHPLQWHTAKAADNHLRPIVCDEDNILCLLHLSIAYTVFQQ